LKRGKGKDKDGVRIAVNLMGVVQLGNKGRSV